MPLTWIEDSSSRSATIYRLGRKDASTRTRVFHVIGTSNEDTLHAAANVAISTTYPFWTYPGQPLVRLRAESYSVEYQGDTAWKVTINYEKTGADDPTQTTPSKRARAFDTTGGTQHITNAIQGAELVETFPGSNVFVADSGERKYGVGGLNDATAMNGAIGVDDRGVNGVDILVPALQWSESYEVPSNYVTSAYIRNVANLTATVNNATFRGFKKGEVLFTGASGSAEDDQQKGNGPWSLTYKFVASPNCGTNGTKPALSCGAITGVEKGGHEYLWVRYSTKEDNAKNQLGQEPIAVYVNRVYHFGDFSLLGIGVT